jgi:ABC-type antimicrobial peptide transport system permease subunit
MAIRGARPLGAQAETWIRADEGGAPPGAWSQAIVDRGGVVVEVLEAAGMVDLHTQDPLLTAGWTGLLALSFLTVVLASSSGLLLYAYTEARERQGEFALLRSLGFSRLQMNGVVWFNLALVVSWGVVMGILGGLWLGGALLPLLEVAEEGTRVTPPMVLQINWAALAAAFGALMAAMFASVVALAWSLSHMDLQRLLRMEAA